MSMPTRGDVKLHLIELLAKYGAMKTTAVYAALAEKWGLSEFERTATRSGASLYQNEIRWARQELAMVGILERPEQSGRATWKLKDVESIAPEDYDDVGKAYVEGATRRISVNAYERNKAARDKCLDAHGFSCTVCGFNFEEVYGEEGKRCIHVHHIVELSAIKGSYKVDPLRDLVPVCPNCHYLIHRRRPAFTLEEVRSMIGRLKTA